MPKRSNISHTDRWLLQYPLNRSSSNINSHHPPLLLIDGSAIIASCIKTPACVRSQIESLSSLVTHKAHTCTRVPSSTRRCSKVEAQYYLLFRSLFSIAFHIFFFVGPFPFPLPLFILQNIAITSERPEIIYQSCRCCTYDHERILFLVSYRSRVSESGCLIDPH